MVKRFPQQGTTLLLLHVLLEVAVVRHEVVSSQPCELGIDFPHIIIEFISVIVPVSKQSLSVLVLLSIVTRADLERALCLEVLDLLHVELLHELWTLQRGHLGLIAGSLSPKGLVLAEALLHDGELRLEITGKDLRVWLHDHEVVLEVVVEVLLLQQRIEHSALCRSLLFCALVLLHLASEQRLPVGEPQLLFEPLLFFLILAIYISILRPRSFLLPPLLQALLVQILALLSYAFLLLENRMAQGLALGHEL